jgi:broad specificity phosphatase PhoE
MCENYYYLINKIGGDKMNKTIISIRRHEIREKDSEGNKLVHLTKEAYKRAKYYGTFIQADNILGYHSKEPRAKQTIQAVLEGAGITKPEEVMYLTHNVNEIDFDLNPEYKKELKKFPEYDDRINFLIQNPDISGKTETMMQSAKRVLKQISEVYGKIKERNGVFHIEKGTHGPLVEATLIQLVDPTIKDIKYLHGGFREGENLRIELEKGLQKLYFRGESCNIKL